MVRGSNPAHITDDKLLELFQQADRSAWSLFCDKYSDFIYTVLRRTGFDYDDAMERFVFICEKLCEQNFRRLKTIQYPSEQGDIKPWLRQVIKRLCVSWAWSEDGRKRLLNFVAEMPQREQRIFQLHFWQGQTPFEIYETLRLEHDTEVELGHVFEGLEKIFGHLSEKKLWRLLSNLSRTRRTFSLEHEDDENSSGFEPIDTTTENAEENLQKKEMATKLNEALKDLSRRELLVLQFRYEEGMTLGETAKMLGWEEREAVNLHKSALYKLRKHLK